MKVVNEIDDSYNGGIGERIICVVELEHNVFVDVMHIVEEDYFYIMNLVGGEAYDDKNNPLDYKFDAGAVLDFVEKERTRYKHG